MTKSRKRPIFVITGPPPVRCGVKPSPRSTARCEMPPGHEGAHAGRTKGGYWKFWRAAELED